jgi:hypothetical protein
VINCESCSNMNDESLEQLMQQTDAAFQRPPHAVEPATLLTALRRRRMRATGLRSVAALGAALAIVAPLLIERPSAAHIGSAAPTSDWSLKRPVHPADGARIPSNSPRDLDAIRAELARLDQEAEERQRIVEAVMRSDVETDAGSVGALYGMELIRLETARSAALSLQYAIQVEEEFEDAEAARREYQRVAERFPGTVWAQVASTSERRLASTPPVPTTL